MSDSTSERDYFCCPILMDGKERFILWYSNTQDGVWTEDSLVLCWASRLSLLRYAIELGLSVSDEPATTFDLDKIDGFNRSISPLKEGEKLDAWNLLSDVATSVGGKEFIIADSESRDVYSRLFHLNCSDIVGIPQPDPLRDDENQVVRRILSLGLKLLEERLRCLDNTPD